MRQIEVRVGDLAVSLGRDCVVGDMIRNNSGGSRSGLGEARSSEQKYSEGPDRFARKRGAIELAPSFPQLIE